MTRHLLGALRAVCSWAVGFAVVSACSSSGRDQPLSAEGSVTPDGGAAGGNGGRNEGDGAASGGGANLPLGAVSCGDATCLPGTSSVQSTACCTDSGACGLRTVLSSKCLSKNERGGVDNRCAPFEIPGKITLPGCCSPAGCGALATFDQIGCIPNADLGRAEMPCIPDIPFD